LSKQPVPDYILQDKTKLEDSSIIKFMHISDSHLGFNHSAFINNPHTNINLKVEDLERSLEYCIDLAIKSNVDFILHTGDLFQVNRPHFNIILSCMNILKKLKEKNIPFVVIAGNHDRTYSLSSSAPIELLRYVDNVIPIPKNDIIFLPSKSKTVKIVGISYQPKDPDSKIERIITELEEKYITEPPADYSILMLHQTLLNGKKGEYFMVEDQPLNEEKLPTNFHYIALGHLHLNQHLSHPLKESLPIAYAGSTEKVSFNEIKEIKQGFFGILDSGVCKISSFYIPSRPIYSLKIEMKNPQTSLEVEKIIKDSLSQVKNDNSFIGIQIEGELSQKFVGILSPSKFRKHFPNQAGVMFSTKKLTVIGLQGEKLTYEGKWINSDQDELKLVLEDMKDIDKERKNDLLSLGSQIIQEFKGN
jgi:DNA repair exonuclease SbcCD nuclease subunit